MSMGGSQEVKETADEKARAEIAQQQQDRWEEKFQPIENMLIADVKDTRPERRQALGTTTSDTTQAFGLARPKVEAQLTEAGARPGSSRFNLSVTGMGEDEGAARGLSSVGANNVVDDQYYAGLGTLSEMGRGQQAGALQGLSQIADISARQAQSDAAVSAANRTGWGNAAGLAAGAATRGLAGWKSSAGVADVPQVDFGADTGFSR